MTKRPLLFALLALNLVLALTPSAHAQSRGFTMTMAGDTSFNGNRFLPDPQGLRMGKSLSPFAVMAADVAPLIDGDLNFANLETVVSDRADLIADGKKYAFETHPNAVAMLLRMGFNFFNTANNHAYDFGLEGAAETRAQLEKLQAIAPFHHAGGGLNRLDAAQPVIFTLNGFTIAVSAMSFIDPKYEATDTQAGFLNYLNETDFNLILRQMKKVRADLKILSIHYGHETYVELDPGQQTHYRRALDEAGIDLVVGHGPHVVRPIEVHNGKLIIYSLGNFLIAGAANIDDRPLGKNYGLFARVHFAWDPVQNKLKAQAIEAVPLRGMSIHPKQASAEIGAAEISFLNQLGLVQVGRDYAPLRARADGTGVYCLPTDLPLTVRAAQACSQL